MQPMPHLGRRQADDSRDFRARALLQAEPEEPKRTWRYWWNAYSHRNQGSTGTCVGHAWSHLLNAKPEPFAIYDWAILNDEWADNDHDPERAFGTSVRAGGQALRETGEIEAFAFAWDLDTIVNWILTRGPVVAGTWWYSHMWEPDANGFLWPRGDKVGGHAFLVDGVNLGRRVARCMQSWDYGPFWLELEALRDLIEDGGEAAMPVEAKARTIVAPEGSGE